MNRHNSAPAALSLSCFFVEQGLEQWGMEPLLAFLLVAVIARHIAKNDEPPPRH